MTSYTLWQMGFAFMAGLILNLTPCVLPVIPLKINGILKEVGKDAFSRITAMFTFYLGCLSVFMILALGTVYLGMTWGALFQSKLFIYCLVFILTAASMATFFELSIPLPNKLYNTHAHRLLDAFLTGALISILSTPCTGPFLGGVLTYAFTQPPIVVFSLYFSIATGLSFPYMVLLLSPKLLAILPKGGAWTHGIEMILGFILLAAAVFFAQSIINKPYSEYLWWIWSGLAFFWIFYTLFTSNTRPRKLVALVFIIAPIAVLSLQFNLFNLHNTNLQWTEYSDSRLTMAKKNKQPVILDFTADWCLNCKAIEQTVFRDPEFVYFAKKHNVALFTIDMTNYSEAQQNLLAGYGGNGIPFIVILNSNGEVVYTFSGLFRVDDLLEKLQKQL